jgi:hypothetical protein
MVEGREERERGRGREEFVHCRKEGERERRKKGKRAF